MWAGRFTRQHPYLVAGLIAVRVAFGGIGPAAMLAARGVHVMSTRLQASMMAGSFAARLMTGAIILGVMAIGNEMVPAARRWGQEMWGVEGAWSNIRNEIGATRSAGYEAIPIVGRLIASFYELYRAIVTLYNVQDERESRRAGYESEVTTASGRYRVQRRSAQIAGQSRFQSASPEVIRREAAGMERTESLMRTAALMYHEEIRGREMVARYLRQQGIVGQEHAEATARIVRIQEQRGDELNAEAERLVSARGPFGMLGRDMPNAVRESILQLGQLSEILRTINTNTSTSGPGSPGYGVLDGPEIPYAYDGYVQRGGLMGVASGDLIVSRRHLAEAITARRGALAGPAVGSAPVNNLAGPQPSVVGGSGELAVTVPVMIDGREVARAVGRANIQQLERGGGDIAPGERRSLRETGFRRNV